ncbi:hypothetical protein BurJ1DRAFT_1747 [Burkholderiales bacterium JOSHI_001]|nr:hypothetical protein BurJ1DRAFT_1747 [Burkholderiales bacterium JOSHI_001]
MPLFLRPFLLAAGLLAAAAAGAQNSPAPAPTEEPVVVPQVQRRDVKLPRLPSRDFEVGAFAGSYSVQGFEAVAVAGLRAGYHITEDFFVEAAVGRAKVNDETFRKIFAGTVLASDRLSYYNVSLGYNVMPGEVFFGRTVAKASAVYLIGGVGSTQFNDRRHQTLNFGAGIRLFLRDWAAVQVDMRDHIFSDDLLGARRRNNNLEFTGGLTFFF